MTDKVTLAKLTADLVSSYVGNRSLSDLELENAIERLPALIDKVHEALLKIVAETAPEAPPAAATISGSAAPATTTPAQEPRQTIFPDHLICLEDGLSFKTLKRHLAAHHGLTPEAYRQKWGLPDDYPMAAPEYASTRAAIAKNIGLGAAGRGGKPGALRSRQGVAPRGKR